MKKRNWILVGISLIGLILIDINYQKNDRLHYFEELFFFSKQEIRDTRLMPGIKVLNIEDLELDSLQAYFKGFKPGVLTLLNFPYSSEPDQSVSNHIGIYEDIDKIKYSYYGNLYISPDNSILKKIKPEYKNDENLYLDYFGQIDSFQSLYFDEIEGVTNMIIQDTSAIILVGYAGKSFYPLLDGDSTEAWNTPRGLMYDTVLKANIVADFMNGIFIRKFNQFELFIYSLVISLTLLVAIRKIISKSRWSYVLFKLIQTIHLLVIIGLQLIFTSLIFPLGLGLLVIFIFGETFYWTLYK